MSRSIREYLEHIEKEASFLYEKSRDLTFGKFVDDETLTRAFLRSIEIIGEASKNVPLGFRKSIRKLNGEKWRACAIN